MSSATVELEQVDSTSAKAEVIDLLRRLPDNVSLERIVEEIIMTACEKEVESDRSLALAAISRLPTSATFEDIEDEIQLMIGLREADDDIAAGRVFSHEEVMRIAASWSTQSSGPHEP